MESLRQRADQADDLLKTLLTRVAGLETKSSSSVPPGPGIHKEVLAYVTKEVKGLKQEIVALGKENEKLSSQNKALSAKLAKAGSGGSGDMAAYKAHNDKSWEQVKVKARKLRADVQVLEEENKALKAEVAELKKGGGKDGKLFTDQLTQDQLDWLKNKMRKVKSDVESLLAQKDSVAAAVAPCAGGMNGSKVKQTMDTVKELKHYFVTLDLAELKKEWFEAELGELDDEDFEIYLGRKVRAIEVEEDDDTINVRFDNHDTQWFPVGCLYFEDPNAAPVVAAKSSEMDGYTAMTMETIKERKQYKVIEDLTELKKQWYGAELGELDDEDFEGYLGRMVKSLDIESDDDTVNCRFDNHDTQFFPVGCLYAENAGGASKPAAKKVAKKVASVVATRVKMTMDTIKERKQYRVTTDIAELKREWYEAELGELDDEDFELYLNREVKSLDVEEDDDTVNVRFDNHDTQWFPVGCLYQVVEGGVPKVVADLNKGRTKQHMDSIKERKQYFVTLDIKELKKEWYEAELGELDDEDFQIYLGREVKSLDVEEDDDTVNVRFDNHDTQWFPVGCLYQA